MSDRFLAFRCFGTFAWPPLPGADPDKARVEGVVEIYYVLEPVDKRLVGCLRWVPSELWTTDLAFTMALADIDYVEGRDSTTKAEAEKARNAHFNGVGNSIVSLRFDVPKGKGYLGADLAFAGMHLFEQHAASKDAKQQFSHSLDLRVPVLKDYSGDGKKQVRSRLVIGLDKEYPLRLEMAIALVTPLDDEQRKAGRAFLGICALYPASRAEKNYAAQKQVPALGRLYFGRQTPKREVIFKNLKAPASSVLGGFTFAERATHNVSTSVAIDENAFWPSKESILGHLLPALGLRVSQANMDSFELEFDDSLRMLMPTPDVAIRRLPSGDKPGVRIEQRVGINTTTQESGYGENSDIRVRGKLAQVRAPGMDDGWLTFNEHLHITLVTSVVIDDDEVWETSHPMTVEASIGGMTLYSASELAKERLKSQFDDPRGNGSRLISLVYAAVSAMDQARLALHQLAPVQPQSSFPLLEGTDASADGYKHFRLYSRFPGKFTLTAAEHDTPAAWSAMLADPDDSSIFSNAQTAIAYTRIELRASWPSLHRQPQPVLCYLTHDVTEDNQRNLSGLRLGLQQAQALGNGVSLSATLGGLELGHRGMFIDAGWLRVGLRNDPGVSATSSMLALELGLKLRTGTVDPVAVDVLRGDRSGRKQPLMYRETVNQTGSGEYKLNCREVVRGDQQWHMACSLIEDIQSNSGPVANLLIGQEPFAIQRFYSMPLDTLGGDENATIAIYDSDEQSWKFKLNNPLYHYVLPPQAIGESMDKPRRLELHDADTEAELAAEGYLRPMPPEDPPIPLGLRRRAIEFRLTPPAHLWLQPSDVERNYVFPQWAAEVLFNQQAELGLGCALTALHGEFLYGLAFGITPALEKGPARRARVAEIEALTGRPVAPLEGAGGAPQARWKQLFQALRTRPQRLEVWADDPLQQVQFAPARFSDGARFALRATSLHRPAVAALEAPIDAHKGPGAPGQEVPGLSPRLHPFGLSGGALWPIESLNVLNLVLRQPRASGGTIEKIALSPLGGDADQSVKFNNNRVAIISETRGGFVQRQKVEVIGRIAVFWHRAKHVVVYERTVNPSAQFTPEGGIGTRTRRPVLRKVSEYIEILEPERRYPDSPTAPLHSNCFLKALRFNRRIIPVDSFWGEEVGSTGWMIPLWNRHAARQRPQVYSMPDVVFVSAAEGDGDDPQVAQECLNPENLYFFADTSPEQTDNTDGWEIRKGIDYTDLPPPKAGPGDAPTTCVPVGFARFTWRLAPASQRTTINAGRANKPIYAGLETLTFMRAGRRESEQVPPTDGTRQLVEALPGAARAASAKAELFMGVWAKGKVVDGPLSELSQSLASVLEGLTEDPPAADAIAKLKQRFEALAQAALPDSIEKSGLGTHFQNLRTTCDQSFTAFKSGFSVLDNGLTTICQTLPQNLEGALSARRLAIAQEIEAWRRECVARLPNTLPPEFADRPTFIGYLEKELKAILLPLFESTSAELGKLRRGIEVARLTASEAVGAGHAWFTRARAELDALEKSVDESKPWSQARRQELEEQIRTVLERTATSLKGELDSARQRLSAELDDLAQRSGAIIGRAIEETLQGRALLGNVPSLAERLQVLGAALPDNESLEKRIVTLNAAIGPIEQLGEGAAAVVEAVNEWRTYAQQVLKQAGSQWYPRLKQVVDSAQNTLTTEVQEAAKMLMGELQRLEARTQQLRKALPDEVGTDHAELVKALDLAVAALSVQLSADSRDLLSKLETLDQWFEYQFEMARAVVAGAEQSLVNQTEPLYAALREVVNNIDAQVATVEKQLRGDILVDTLVSNLLKLPALLAAIDRFATPLFDLNQATVVRHDAALALIEQCGDELIGGLENATALLSGVASGVGKICKTLSTGVTGLREQLLKEATDTLAPLQGKLNSFIEDTVKDIETKLGDPEQYKQLLQAMETFDRDVRELGNGLAATRNLLEDYGERVADAVGRIGEGGLLATPNNILRAMAAFGATPELPHLDFSALRSPYFFGWVDDSVAMAPINAWFGRLGDDLKALGLDLQIDRLGDRLLPVDLSQCDICQVLRNISGLDLRNLLPGYPFPAAARDAIRISHEFDKKSLRAWVQVDVDLPLPERRALFSIGPVSLDLVNARVSAVVRLEASKDTAQVTQSGSATLLSDFDAVVGGQSMVTLRQVAVRYDQSSGLKVNFDPRQVRLNPSFEFIQNTFQSIIGDEVGGLKVIKENGLPVGVEHLFSLPPMGMMFGTSGVQNIQISNAFRLLAFPDFLISNSFALARSDLPFVFSVFIIGGSGWLTVDVNYRPFQNELAVVVDAAAGGSGSLGFSFCGVSGTVSISLNVALTYRKLIGKPGGGLTVSMVVVIVGVVDVLRIASAYLSVTLRLSYQDNGDIDATGSFRVSIRISRFFTVSAGGQVRYRMSGGRKEVTRQGQAEVSSQSYEKARKLIQGQGRNS